MPIDVHVPGCPPRPEALAHGILRLREKVQGATQPEGWRERYDAVGTEEIPAGEEIERGAINGIPKPGDTAGA